MATIRDVAESAGVSTATVSFTFNTPEKVRPETRDRVLAAAKALSFRPNRTARALRTGRQQIVGVIASDLQLPFVGELVRAARDAAADAGELAVIVEADAADLGAGGPVDDLVDRGIDAFVLCPAPQVYPAEVLAHLTTVRDRGVALAVITNALTDFPGDIVHTQAREATAAMVRHLVDLGHIRIAWVGLPVGANTVGQRRWDGFCDGIRQAGLSTDAELRYGGPLNMDTGRDAGRHFLNLPDPPTAVIASSDLVAAGVIMECHRTGVQVPSELSVAGFNAEPIGEQLFPALTTVRLAAREAGTLATELALSRRLEPETESRSPALGFDVIVRDSTAAIPR